jgi:hypothetical protein
VGHVNGGFFTSALDYFEDKLRRMWKEMNRPQYGYCNVGFASVSDALSRASQGYSQRMTFNKSGSPGVAGTTNSLWRNGNNPSSGASPASAPGGTVYTSATAGALAFTNPASGTNHLVGADVGATVAGMSLLLYDLIFGVNKTMNSTTTEAVTGVPTRYQSTTTTAADYIGDNFCFIQVGGTALAATGHNWTVCTYTDQANAASTLPSVTGVSGAIVDRLDTAATGAWFHPLEAGDTGIKALTQIQCSAAVATGVIWFMIGHPIGFMSFPLIYSMFPFNWLTNRDQAPRVFDNACLAFLEPAKVNTSGTAYTGRIVLTNAA